MRFHARSLHKDLVTVNTRTVLLPTKCFHCLRGGRAVADTELLSIAETVDATLEVCINLVKNILQSDL